MTPRRRRHRKGGFSLPELMIAASLSTVITLGVIYAVHNMRIGFALTETKNAVREANQRTLNTIHRRLLESVRIFDNSLTGNAYLGALVLTSAPARAANTRLPIIEPGGSLSTTSPNFIAAGVGNSLFFASLSTGTISVTVNNAASVPTSVSFSRYRFYYYFLSPTADFSTPNGSPFQLYEWKSNLFVDYNEFQDLTDNTLKINASAAVLAQGYTVAWSPSNDYNAAFFTVNNAGTFPSLGSYSIPMQSVTNMTKPQAGFSTDARGGVPPNTSAAFTLGTTVIPGFATANAPFPGGFEVLIVGSNGAREVYVRLVTVGMGAFRGYVVSDENVLATTKDLW